MFKKNFNNNRYSGPSNQFQGQMFSDQKGYNPGMMQGPPQGMQQESSIYPQVQEDRLQFEIQENRRRINNLTKRIIRLENYLRIRDTSDYVNVDDDHLPNEFSM